MADTATTVYQLILCVVFSRPTVKNHSFYDRYLADNELCFENFDVIPCCRLSEMSTAWHELGHLFRERRKITRRRFNKSCLVNASLRVRELWNLHTSSLSLPQSYDSKLEVLTATTACRCCYNSVTIATARACSTGASHLPTSQDETTPTWRTARCQGALFG